MLVRERADAEGFDRVNYTQAANVSTTAAASETENAAVDAKKLDTGMMASVEVRGGEMNTDGNSHFVRKFVEKVIPRSERNSFVDSKGNLSQRGENRLRNALFQRAYGDSGMTEKLAEATDAEVKNVIKAMTNVAPRIALMQADVEGGRLADLVPDQEIVQAYQAYRNLKQSGQSVEAYLAQLPLIKMDAEAVKLLVGMFEENRNAPSRTTEALESVLNVVREMGDPDQMTIPGFERSEESINVAVGRSLAGHVHESA
ncbi:MAG: hypothetical protein AB9880_05605 [Christensenellales bacterium]